MHSPGRPLFSDPVDNGLSSDSALSYHNLPSLGTQADVNGWQRYFSHAIVCLLSPSLASGRVALVRSCGGTHWHFACFLREGVFWGWCCLFRILDRYTVSADVGTFCPAQVSTSRAMLCRLAGRCEQLLEGPGGGRPLTCHKLSPLPPGVAE